MMTSALKYFNERKSSKVSRHDDSESVFEHDVANGLWILPDQEATENAKSKMKEILYQASMNAKKIIQKIIIHLEFKNKYIKHFLEISEILWHRQAYQVKCSQQILSTWITSDTILLHQIYIREDITILRFLLFWCQLHQNVTVYCLSCF